MRKLEALVTLIEAVVSLVLIVLVYFGLLAAFLHAGHDPAIAVAYAVASFGTAVVLRLIDAGRE